LDEFAGDKFEPNYEKSSEEWKLWNDEAIWRQR
jgi:hypothetical protein